MTRSAIKMQQVTRSMGSVVKGMDKVLSSMNIEAISKVMDSFETSFEDMDVRSEYVEQAMNSSTASSMPVDEVDLLMQQVSDEHGLAIKFSAADAGTAPVQQSRAAPQEAGEDALEKRLAALRG